MTSLSSFVLSLCLCLCLTYVNGNKYDEALSSTETPNYKEYCVIGAGPGGLQMAYFLENAARDYIVFERNNQAGSFFQKFPIHRRLLSINKIHTGKTNKEFNLRHDWNSLLSHDESLKFTKYTKEYYPNGDTLVKYLNDFATKLNLKIQYNSTMHDVMKREDKLFQMWDQHDNAYTCKYVIMATGIAKPKEMDFEGSELVEGYENLSTNLSDYRGQSVYIYGRGNAAHETASFIGQVTNVVHMLGRSPTRLAWATHYVGDIRAVNSGILDTYQLKSLDGMYEGLLSNSSTIVRSILDGKLYMEAVGSGRSNVPGYNDISSIDNIPDREGYNRIIRCIGFEFDNSIFHSSIEPTILEHYRDYKYPGLTYAYRSLNVTSLYFAGANTHSIDYRKSSGGFIQGYRYTALSLHRILEWRNHDVQWPAVNFNNPLDLMTHILKSINEASDIASMFKYICHVVIFDQQGISSKYLETFPCYLVSRLQVLTGYEVPGPVMVITMEFGKNYSGAGVDPFPIERTVFEASASHRSSSLHPVFYFYKQVFNDQRFFGRPLDWTLPIPDRLLHLMEDFSLQYDLPSSHVLMLRRFMEETLGHDLRNWFAEDCLKISLTSSLLPFGCHGNNSSLITRSTELLTSSLPFKQEFLPFQIILKS